MPRYPNSNRSKSRSRTLVVKNTRSSRSASREAERSRLGCDSSSNSSSNISSSSSSSITTNTTTTTTTTTSTTAETAVETAEAFKTDSPAGSPAPKASVPRVPTPAQGSAGPPVQADSLVAESLLQEQPVVVSDGQPNLVNNSAPAHQQQQQQQPRPRRKPLSKSQWKLAKGARKKPKRLHLQPDPADGGITYCPIESCTHTAGFLTERGCRKHVSNLHAWYYYFDNQPKEEEVFPPGLFRQQAASILSSAPDCTPSSRQVSGSGSGRTSKPSTRNMPSFKRTCAFAVSFVHWLKSDWGGARGHVQAVQTCSRILKYLRYSFPDCDGDWDVPPDVVEVAVASTEQLTDFVEHLRDYWKMGYSGVVGYLNAINDVVDYRRMKGGFTGHSREVVEIIELLLGRTKKAMGRKMRIEWRTILNIDNFEAKGCWASVEDLQTVVPYHQGRFSQIICSLADHSASATVVSACEPVGPYDLSFCTHFIAGVLFLEVKASRPMVYQHLTVDMIKSIKTDQIDATIFKTQERYGFDTLIFEANHIHVLKLYIAHIRPRLNPGSSPYLMVTRNGNQMTKFSSILGNLVHQACGRYIHPTRLRQIIETESAQKLSKEQQQDITDDQKHCSDVAKVHYQLDTSRHVARRAKKALRQIGISSRLSTASLPPAPLLPEASSLQPQQSQQSQQSQSVAVCTSSLPEQKQTQTLTQAAGRHHADPSLPIKTDEATVDGADQAGEGSFSSSSSSSSATHTTRLLKTTGHWQQRSRPPARKVLFTEEEDICLKNGLMKYGWAAWARILRDPDYSFHPNRSSQTLMQRARQMNLKDEF